MNDNSTTTGNSPLPRAPVHLAIVGGGISGLCLALGLLNLAPHITFHIYEAAQQFAEIGAGVAIGINAQRALQKLDSRLAGAYGKLRTSNVDSHILQPDGSEQDRSKATYLRLVMGMDHARDANIKAGREICEVFCEGGFSSVHRARFLDAIVALLPDHVTRECVTFGARLVSATGISNDGPINLTFASGLTVTADAVIGCDGVRSITRQLLFGRSSPSAHPVFSGKYAYRGLVPMSKAVAALGDRSARNGSHRLGYDGHVLTFPIDKGRTMNVVAFRTKTHGWDADADWIAQATREAMHEDFKGWGDEVHAILDMMERCDKWALFDHPPTSTYYCAGKVCLIGDAAHASTPHHGSGAGMGIEDAYVLAGLLGMVHGKEELQKAFSTFEATRLERTQKLIWSSRQQAALYDFQAEGVGDDVEKIASIMPSRWDWIWDHDIQRELQEAQKATA